MKRYSLSLVVLLLLSTVAWAGTIVEDIINPYVQVTTDSGSIGAGTCIKLGDEQLVLTAFHVVGDDVVEHADKTAKTEYKPVQLHKIVDKRRIELPATVVWTDEKNDLALLKPKVEGIFKSAHFKPNQQVNVGDDVYAVGSGDNIHAMLSRGVISDTNFEIPKRANIPGTYFLYTGPIWQGSSGGGLFVRDDHNNYVLIGVVVRSGPDENIALARRLDEINLVFKNYLKTKTPDSRGE